MCKRKKLKKYTAFQKINDVKKNIYLKLLFLFFIGIKVSAQCYPPGTPEWDGISLSPGEYKLSDNTFINNIPNSIPNGVKFYLVGDASASWRDGTRGPGKVQVCDGGALQVFYLPHTTNVNQTNLTIGPAGSVLVNATGPSNINSLFLGDTNENAVLSFCASGTLNISPGDWTNYIGDGSAPSYVLISPSGIINGSAAFISRSNNVVALDFNTMYSDPAARLRSANYSNESNGPTQQLYDSSDTCSLVNLDGTTEINFINDYHPSISVTKVKSSGPDVVTSAGEVLEYTITVQNDSPMITPQDNVKVIDTFFNGTVLPVGSPTGDLNNDNLLDIGEVWVYTVNYTVTQSDIDSGAPLVNTVSVTTDTDLMIASQTASTPGIPVSGNASISVTKVKSSGPDVITAAGEVLGYTITVGNTGTVSQSNVNITDTLSNGTVLTLGVPSGDTGNDDILGVGETWEYTVSYTVTQSDIDAGGSIFNEVSVTTNSVTIPETDVTPGTPVNGNASISVRKVKSSGPDVITAAGEILGYTITVGNIGTVSQSNVNITDTLSNGTVLTLGVPRGDTGNDGILGVGETWIYTVSYTVTQSDIDAGGSISNGVSVTTDEVPIPEEVNTLEVLIEKECLKIYNGFSPDNDGINDTFRIECIENYPKNRLVIFNRWGNEVYKANGYKNKWSGEANTGVLIDKSNRELPIGTYYYILDLNDGSKPRTGFVYLTR